MINFHKYSKIADDTFYKRMGRVENVVGLTIESAGPEARLGDLCRIYPADEQYAPIMAEVVGFKDRRTLLMPTTPSRPSTTAESRRPASILVRRMSF